jgi:hypothetical protein
VVASIHDSTRAGDTNTASLDLPVPATSDDDVTLIYVHRENNASVSISVPGFQLVEGSTTVSANVWTYVYWKRNDGTESGNYTLTFGNAMWTEAEAVTISGIDPATENPIEACHAVNGTGTTFPTVSIDTDDDDPVLIWFGDTYSPDADTPPTNFTEIEDNSRLTSLAYRLPGASGTYSTASGSGSHTTSDLHAATLVCVSATGSPVPPVAYVGAGTAIAGTTSITTAAYPAGWAEGDLIVGVVASNHATTEATEPDISGFTKIGTLSGGGGAQGAGTGPRRLTFFTREAQSGDDTTPTVSLSGGNVMIAGFLAFHKASGRVWDAAVAAFGAEATAGTGWTQAMTSNPGFDADDMALLACAVRDTSNSTVEGITATGATFGSVTERIDLSSETGNDIALHASTCTVTAGPATANATRTATHSTSETGVMGVLLIRSSPGSTPNEGTASGSWAFTGSATGKRSPKATGSGSWAFAGSATGKRSPKATGSGSWAFAGTATGKRAPKATGSGSWAFAGSATGDMPPDYGAATGAFAFTGSAAGKRAPKATAGGSFSFTGSAVGDAPPNQGAASGSWSFAGSASGERDPKATAEGSFSFTGSAVGEAPAEGISEGTATGTVDYAGTATGYRAPKATGSGSWTFAGSATGDSPSTGTAGGTTAYAGSAVGKRVASSAPVGTWAFTGAATGKRSPEGTAGGTFQFTGIAFSSNASTGQAVGSWSLAGAATGRRNPKGAASGTLSYAGSAVGDTVGKATADGTTAYVGTAVGARESLGAASGGIMYVGTAVGTTSMSGAASGAVVWVGEAVGANVTIPTPVTRTVRIRGSSRTGTIGPQQPTNRTTRPKPTDTVEAVGRIPAGQRTLKVKP